MLSPCSTERSTALLAATSSVFGFVFDSARTEFDCGGHQSVRITEKHYAPWVRARQEQLEADVRRTWETPEPQGTRRVHEKAGACNCFQIKKKEWCRRGESNPRPRDYETLALPLSYAGLEQPLMLRIRLQRCQGALNNIYSAQIHEAVPNTRCDG